MEYLGHGDSYHVAKRFDYPGVGRVDHGRNWIDVDDSASLLLGPPHGLLCTRLPHNVLHARLPMPYNLLHARLPDNLLYACLPLPDNVLHARLPNYLLCTGLPIVPLLPVRRLLRILMIFINNLSTKTDQLFDPIGKIFQFGLRAEKLLIDMPCCFGKLMKAE